MTISNHQKMIIYCTFKSIRWGVRSSGWLCFILLHSRFWKSIRVNQLETVPLFMPTCSSVFMLACSVCHISTLRLLFAHHPCSQFFKKKRKELIPFIFFWFIATGSIRRRWFSDFGFAAQRVESSKSNKTRRLYNTITFGWISRESEKEFNLQSTFGQHVALLEETQAGQSHDGRNGSSPQQREQRTVVHDGGDGHEWQWRWTPSASPTASHTH